MSVGQNKEGAGRDLIERYQADFSEANGRKIGFEEAVEFLVKELGGGKAFYSYELKSAREALQQAQDRILTASLELEKIEWQLSSIESAKSVTKPD